MKMHPANVWLGNRWLRLVDTAGLSDGAAAHAARAKSNATLYAYRGQVARFDAWCARMERTPWEVSTVGDYLTACYATGLGRVSLSQSLTAIRLAYRAAGEPTDSSTWAPVRAVLKGCERAQAERGAWTIGAAEPLRLVELSSACVRLYAVARDGGPLATVATRDRCMLLLAFLGGLRRSELVGLNLSDVTTSPEGLTLRLRSTKTRPGEAVTVTIPRGEHAATDPLTAWRDWLAVRPPELFADGAPAFVRAGDGGARYVLGSRRIGGKGAVSTVLRRALRLAGVEHPERYRSHSLRAGLATELAEAGVSMVQIANAGRWESLDTTLRYARRARRWSDAPQRALRY